MQQEAGESLGEEPRGRSVSRSITARLTLTLLASVAVATAVPGLIAVYVFEGAARQSEAREVEAARHAFSVGIEVAAKRNLALASALAAMAPVRDLVARRDREGLYRFVQPIYAELHERHQVDNTHFHTEKLITVLRMHQPENYGDDLSAFRHILADVASTGSPRTGLEEGVNGLPIRGVAPVLGPDGARVGQVEVGTFVTAPLLRLLAPPRVQFTVMLQRPPGQLEVFASSLERPARMLDGPGLEAALAGGLVRRGPAAGSTGEVLVAADAVRDYAGRKIGVVEVLVETSPIAATLGALRKLLLIGLLLALLAALATATVLGERLAAPIRLLTGAARQLAQRLPEVAIPATERQDEIGEMARALAVFRDDAVALRNAEERLRQSEKLEGLGQLTGGVAHDFNNLLFVILASLEMLEERCADLPDVQEHVKAALEAGRRGVTLTKSLLAFARRQVLTPQSFSAGRLIEEFVPLIQRAVGELVTVRFEAPAGLWLCRADPGQLQNALLNLAVNARDAMPKGGAITIVAANREVTAGGGPPSAGDYVEVTVSDTGEGMSPEVMARAVEPFFTTKDQGKGTGLGLSMVYGFARQSGGLLTLRGTVGTGTQVTLLLPRGAPTPERPVTPSTLPSMPGPRPVLVVDDDPLVRKVTAGLLRAAGYHVVEASAGPEAVALLAARDDFALLLTDVMMPGGLSARGLLAEVERRRPDLPVLFVSGHAREFLGERGELPEGVELLSKPVAKEVLLQRVAAVIARSLAAKAARDPS